MDCQWVQLNTLLGNLHDYETRCKSWCNWEGLPFTLGAQVAHILSVTIPQYQRRPRHGCVNLRHVLTPPEISTLPEPFNDLETWRTLSEWRHPQVNLNLLQLAIIYDNKDCMSCLWHPTFLREEDYQDESSKLVNHPLHLYFSRDQATASFSLEAIRDELFYEEALLDLTPSRILNGTCATGGASSPASASAVPSAAAGEDEVHPVWDMLTRIWTSPPDSSKMAYHSSKPMHLAPFLPGRLNVPDSGLVCKAASKLVGSNAQPSTVQLVRDLATDTHCKKRLIDHFIDVWPYLSPSVEGETLIFLCQWTLTLAGADLERYVDALASLFKHVNSGEEPPIQKAAQYLSTESLIIAILKMRFFESDSNSQRASTRSLVSELLEATLINRDLEDLCVLSVMKAVGGDARKVWSLDQLPVPAKELFHRPFKTICEELTSRQPAKN